MRAKSCPCLSKRQDLARRFDKQQQFAPRTPGPPDPFAKRFRKFSEVSSTASAFLQRDALPRGMIGAF